MKKLFLSLAAALLAISSVVSISSSVAWAGGDQVNRPPFGNPTTPKPPPAPMPNPQAPGK